jgi:hypothetical protein
MHCIFLFHEAPTSTTLYHLIMLWKSSTHQKKLQWEGGYASMSFLFIYLFLIFVKNGMQNINLLNKNIFK